jgi:hypothetical protein
LGANWKAVNTGLTSNLVLSVAVNGNYLFASIVGRGLWKRPLSDIISDVETQKTNIPDGYMLYQNYPNPFNPVTTISYSLPKTANVQIKVFDLLGREIATLVNEVKPVGSYKVKFDGSQLTSGIYFYQMKAGDFISTKKLILLK